MDIEEMIKCIWLLFRLSKWKYLVELGLERGVVEPIFQDFDMRYISSESGKITTKAQAHRLVKMYPPIVNAAVNLQSAYVHKTFLGRGF